jgi:hypothetical protein
MFEDRGLFTGTDTETFEAKLALLGPGAYRGVKSRSDLEVCKNERKVRIRGADRTTMNFS